jgi:uncharacterized membrane protein HdeD (DUF308 family)
MTRANGVEIAPAVLGVITFVAPWVFGFASVTALAWSAWILGILAVLIAGSALYAASADRRRSAVA